MKKKKDTKSKAKDDYLKKFDLWWKTKKTMVIIVIVFIALSGISSQTIC